MLDIDIVTVLLQVVNFLVFTGALYVLALRPALANIRQRAERKERLMEELEADRAAAAERLETLESRLENAEEEAERLIEEAKDEAEVERTALLQEAQEEAERVLSEAQSEAYRLRRQAVEEFHAELVGDVLDVCSMLVGQVAPEELQDAMVQELFDSVWELGRSDMQRVDVLRRALGERTPTVVARTAKPLSPEQQGQLVRTFTALADRNINLDLKVDPALGLGLRVRMGDIVLDNTIAGKLETLREEVSETLREELQNE